MSPPYSITHLLHLLILADLMCFKWLILFYFFVSTLNYQPLKTHRINQSKIGAKI